MIGVGGCGGGVDPVAYFADVNSKFPLRLIQNLIFFLPARQCAYVYFRLLVSNIRYSGSRIIRLRRMS